jgi:hypothetical protein
MPSGDSMRRSRAGTAAVALTLAALASATLSAEPVTVRHVEGIVHGFLVLRSSDGTVIANGDLIQLARGNRVTSRLVFHFADGSVNDETAVFSQQQQFRLVSDHLIQKGPSFPRPIDMTIDAASGQVTVRFVNEHGESKVEAERLRLPADVANGMILTLLKNVPADAAPTTVSFVAATPKPRLVKLVMTPVGQDPFSTASEGRAAAHYSVHVDIGGMSGLLAPLLGKQPPDSHVWVLGGDAPAFVRAQQPLYLGGPLWEIDLVAPAFPTP